MTVSKATEELKLISLDVMYEILSYLSEKELNRLETISNCFFPIVNLVRQRCRDSLIEHIQGTTNENTLPLRIALQRVNDPDYKENSEINPFWDNDNAFETDNREWFGTTFLNMGRNTSLIDELDKDFMDADAIEIDGESWEDTFCDDINMDELDVGLSEIEMMDHFEMTPYYSYTGSPFVNINLFHKASALV